jgi:nitrogen fixation/metabolism regulation signal transduction histidine kinase
MTGIFWWVRQLVLTAIGCFFIVFGIQILIGAYELKDPFSFILTFYASNFMILISAALVIGFVIRMFVAYRNSKRDSMDT